MRDYNNNVICPMLWRGLSVGTLGEVRPCCFWPEIGNLHSSSLEEIWNSETMKEKRKAMLRGEQLPECQICFDQELRGQGSTRLAYTRECKKSKIPLVGPIHTDLDPRIIDLRFSNLCNLKCRTCWAGASSRWQAEVGLEDHLHPTTKKQREELLYLIQNNLDNLIEIFIHILLLIIIQTIEYVITYRRLDFIVSSFFGQVNNQYPFVLPRRNLYNKS